MKITNKSGIKWTKFCEEIIEQWFYFCEFRIGLIFFSSNTAACTYIRVDGCVCGSKYSKMCVCCHLKFKCK